MILQDLVLPNDWFSGLAGWQDSTDLKTCFSAQNRDFRAAFSQVRCYPGWADLFKVYHPNLR
jgi:hypothetical protein